jgi:replicative DNA helicase
MTTDILIQSVDASTEKQILTGIILSTRFLEEVVPVLRTHHLQNEYAKKVMKWVLKYFADYKKAPKIHIQDIYSKKRLTLDASEQTIIENLLSGLSDKHAQQREPFNLDYAVDQTLLFIKKREMETRTSNVLRLLDQGNVEQAEKEITGYSKVARLTSDWYDPFDPVQVSDVFREDAPDKILKFPGHLGNMLGTFERGWLVSVLGPFKRGKTWWLQEVAVLSLFSRLRVVFISLEMPRRKTNERLYKRLTSYSQNGGSSLYPTFDCRSNQDDTCKLPFRTSKGRLLDAEGSKPLFGEVKNYVPCTYCRDNNRRDYKIAYWLEALKRPKWTHKSVVNRVASFREHYGRDSLRIKCYPKFSANLTDIRRDLDILEQTEGFTPDVIVIDYAGILKPESTRTKQTEQLDETWMTLAQLAAERHCLVATGSQGNRESFDVRNVKATQLAGWIGQLAHVDVMFALNQTSTEKNSGLMRVSTMVHRHQDFNQDEEAWVLQNLHQGQIHLDSQRGWSAYE